jgi:rhamnosyltransferase
MKASVVILTKNGRKYIQNSLDAISTQKSQHDLEVIIIDSGSQDGTLGIVKRYPVCLYRIPPESFSHSRTRNFGVSLTSGDYVVYLSQDAVPVDSGWLESLLSPMVKDPLVGAVFGRQIPAADANPVNRFRINWIYGPESSVKQKVPAKESSRKSFNFSNVNSAIRKELLLKFPFRWDLPFCEDIYLAEQLLNAGYKITYSSAAAVFHSHNHGILEIFRRYFDIAIAYRMIGVHENAKKIESEGKRYILEELKYLWKTRQSSWALYAVICDAFKYLGFKAGCFERFLPGCLTKRLSSYWYRQC